MEGAGTPGQGAGLMSAALQMDGTVGDMRTHKVTTGVHSEHILI